MKFKTITLIGVMICSVFCGQTPPIVAQPTVEKSANFIEVVENILGNRTPLVLENGQLVPAKDAPKITLDNVCSQKNAVTKRIFREYGAIYVSRNTIFPPQCIYESESGISSFQERSKAREENLGGVIIKLQNPAMDDLLKAVQAAAKKKLRITPRGGSLAAGRSYQNTENLWNSRFYPALNYWVRQRRINQQQADAAKFAASKRDQIAMVFQWEEEGLFFSKDLKKSILFSVAAPGASQHNFLLALDVEQFANKEVRKILAEHGWFQTVYSDFPHFTYLGLKREELSKNGLRMEELGGHEFWIPNIIASPLKPEIKTK